MKGVEIQVVPRGGIVSDEYSDGFAARLRKALGDNRSQAELLEELKQNGIEISQQRLSHYMNGRNYPDPPILKELARALDVSADWLLGLPTETELPVADLDEMIASNKGEGYINKIMNQLPKDKQQMVIQFAEYLLAQNPKGGETALEERRIQREAGMWLDSIERTRGLEARQEVEKVFRDKGLYVDRAS